MTITSNPLESANLGAGGTYIGGRDWNRGLPTADNPARHRGARRQTGLNWDELTANHIARGGQVDAGVWPKTGKVTIMQGGQKARDRIHTFQETDPDAFDYDNTLTHGAPAQPRSGVRVLSDSESRAVCRKYRAGASMRILADEYGVSTKAISNALARNGEPTRDRNDANRRRGRSTS